MNLRLVLSLLLCATALTASAAAADDTAELRADAAAFLEALSSAGLSDAAREDVARLQRESPSRAPADTLAAAQALLARESAAVRAQAREWNNRTRYRIGLSYDFDPTEKIDGWALFGLNLFRFRSPNANRAAPPEERQARETLARLDAADSAGLRAIFTVSQSLEVAVGPPEIVFTHEFLPSLRPSFHTFNFNSAQIRDRWSRELAFWAGRVGSHPAIAQFKIGNEPFWSTQPWPILGYDPATLGCSPEAWLRAALARHGDFATWRSRWPAEVVRGARKHPTAETVPWRGAADIAVSYAQERIRGLTFMRFLERRYGTLAALNAAWFGAERARHFAAWSEVLPPVPETFDATIEIDTAAADVPGPWLRNGGRLARARPADVAAWVDWTDYWPHAVADAFSELRAAGRAVAPRTLFTTSAATAHFVNDANANAISAATGPWVGPSALDSVGIDCYSVQYWQSYLRACRSAAGPNRRVTVLEAGGASGVAHGGVGVDPRNAAFVALFSFAWGADDVLFWRRDNKLEPRVCVEILRARRAIDDRELQHASEPVTDGVVLVYPIEAAHLAAARHGRALPALERFQAATGLLTRLQTSHAVLSDREVAGGALPAATRVVWLPGAFAATAELRAALTSFVARGGRLILDADFSREDRHGRPVAEADRTPLLHAPGALVLDSTALGAWRRSLPRNENGPRVWWSGAIPAALAGVGPFLESAAPSLCRLLAADGKLASDYIAARRGAEALWVFVGPWSGPGELKVRGDFVRARDTYRAADLPVRAADGTTTVALPAGPAVVRFAR
jgi:hypothetical protein